MGLAQGTLTCCEFRYHDLSMFLRLSSELRQKALDEPGGILEG